MLLVLTVVTFFILGRELSLRLWRRSPDSLSFWEAITAAFSLAFALWIASLWIAAFAGQLTAPVLATRNVLVAILAAGLWWTRWRRGERRPLELRWRLLVIALPLMIWSSFILWRGWIVPPLSHDALAYHLPKAALYMRAEGYEPLVDLPARARHIPVNYELLLADTLIVEGDDTFSEWLSLVHYLYLIVASAALVSRWWGNSDDAAAIVALLVAAVPVALLHSGAHKNDLMTAAFMTASMVWIGRFLSTAEFRSLILAAATLAMAFGTKPQAAILAVAALPFAVVILLKTEKGPKRLAGIALLSVLFASILGGGYWLMDRLKAEATAPSQSTPVSYGDWMNVWQVPYVLVAAPFSRSPTSLAVPWSETPWFWRRYEIYFSELGIPFAVCAVLLPLAVFFYRRQVPERNVERLIVSAIAVVTLVAMLPVRFRPSGFYAISAPRYMLFIVPVVFAWTVAPFVRARISPLARNVLLATAVIVFTLYAVLNATRDLFVPTAYVRWAAENRGTRVVPFDPNRAASIVDRAAAPEDAVAIEAAEGAWLYPAFGRDLARPVQLLSAANPAPIASGVDWVVIDRTFLAVWKHPDFDDLSQTRRFITRGATTLRTDPLFRSLATSDRWSLYYADDPSGQAIFRRSAARRRQ